VRGSGARARASRRSPSALDRDDVVRHRTDDRCWRCATPRGDGVERSIATSTPESVSVSDTSVWSTTRRRSTARCSLVNASMSAASTRAIGGGWRSSDVAIRVAVRRRSSAAERTCGRPLAPTHRAPPAGRRR
jgi:hypothetical protein